MNAYRINKFLYEMSKDKEKEKRFIERDSTLYENYELTHEERDALQSCRVTKLYESGVQPLLLMGLTLVLKKDIRELYKKGI